MLTRRVLISPDPREEDMRAIIFLAGVLVATPSSRAEQLIFYTASFPDATSVQLSVVSDSVSHSADYDFEVAIGLIETDATGTIKYVDSGKHHARIKCAEPAYVSVGGRQYLVTARAPDTNHGDWKEDLWKTFCAAPSS
jgi:hypothetical protein